MTAPKTLTATVLAIGFLGSIAEAAPLSGWFGGTGNFSSWYANPSGSVGGYSGLINSPAPVPASPYRYNSTTDVSPIASVSPPAPTPAPAPTPVPAVTSVPTATIASPSASGSPVTAFINFGNAPYAETSNLTTGNPQAWYNSPAVTQAFGGAPTAAQQASFTQTVLADIQRTFQVSGMNVNLTTSPSAPTDHEISVVSGASYPSNPAAIGITDVGASGFGFIDKLAYANTPDQLAWAVAHNVSHELMHALGVATHPDQTGQFLDSATATWGMLTDPNAKLSPQAVQMLLSASAGSRLVSAVGAELMRGGGGPSPSLALRGTGADGAQILEAPVPEPSTIALWTMATAVGIVFARRTSRCKSASTGSSRAQ